ncbi:MULTISPECIES: ectoine/hydroxyectoine ABC transporter permease subunit EhuD [Bradyrhizobium]|uniref:Ectoine/hydroxyectoine ABC transporter permease subunit EhuD n=3 Tax=Bradyrhizobium TaxID=374 RepID=A0A410VJ69_9BRAD|nr:MULTISPECIES: ectoine/hydroxyectoine ABC transporter permease subunit EhuD [Bradyrhizobium]MCG2629330.1 ectoine/hydroxyectoine ABC transporter permease subunit EhuD [Bradyrhizobium zhengyangense]MCG2644611.1 ectoine/hydroxyectoine ABC transporter permease subunit EhuD [Bradyrhizobium zhengyangense]MCG2670844.1 ectoine/hydroxyectoine ABC transporter permease subunit EhuD [Bradyrhizobium zhengyangense]MDN4984476.1 ectoine/hydroxyectoine ABC transporter permease subunit EhuD [Bradyrhizobium sp.
MKVDFQYAWELLPQLVVAAQTTLLAAVLGFIASLLGGLLLFALYSAKHRLTKILVRGYVEFARGVPLLVLIYFLYFVGPSAGVVISPLVTGVIALGLHYSAYMAEVYRAAMIGVPAGQWEASTSINLSTFDTYRRIIVPQMIPFIIPNAGSYFVYMLKDTPLLASISVWELMAVAQAEGARRFQYFEPITMVGIMFLVLSIAGAFLINRLERLSQKGWR